FFLCLMSSVVLAQQPSIAGDWLLTQDIFGNPLHQRMALKLDGAQLSGTIGQRPIDGTLTGNVIRFVLRSDDTIDEFTGNVTGDRRNGTLVRTEKGEQRFKTSWSAKRAPARRAEPPQLHEFVPTTFHRQFSAANPPVLRIWPGDTVHTTTVDAAGVD